MNRLAFALAAGVGLLAASAVTFNGTDSSGSGDLAEPTHWEGGALPGASAAVTFDKGGVLSAGSAVTFGAATISAASPVTFNAANTITLSDLARSAGGAATELRNGTVMSVTTSVELNNDATGVGTRLLVTGAGTKLEQTANNVHCKFSTGAGISNRLDILEGAYVGVNRQLLVGSGAASHSHRLVVGTNSTLQTQSTSGGWSEVVIIGESSPSNRVDVYGTWSAPGGYHQMLIGKNASSSHNTVEVHDGGTLTAVGKWFLGNAGAFNEMIVDAGGTLRQTDSSADRYLYIGNGANSSNNVLRVKAGASFSSAAPVRLGYNGSNNAFDYENPTHLPKVVLGVNANSTGNVFHLHGDGKQGFAGTLSGTVAFGSGTGNTALFENFCYTNSDNGAVCPVPPGNRMIFRNMKFHTRCTDNWSTGSAGSVYEFDNSTWSHYAAGSQHRTLMRDRGTRLKFANNSSAVMGNVYFGACDATDGGCGLDVTGGSTVTLTSLYLHNSNNRLVISNGTLNVNQSFADLTRTTDAYNKATCAHSTNLVIRFEGEAPRFRSNQAATFAYAAGETESDPASIGHHVLDFALPAEAYAEAPFQATSITLPKTTKIRVDLDGYRAYGRQDFLLAEATGEKGVVTVSDLTELASELPSKCRLYLTDDKKQLRMKVKGARRGLRIIFR